jgi:Cu2+-exporting ATPase
VAPQGHRTTVSEDGPRGSPEILGNAAALDPHGHLVADDSAPVLVRSTRGAAASRWIPAVFGTLVFTYGGRVFIQGSVGELRARLPGMMTLISLAVSVAFLFSLAVTFGFPGTDLWWELATLVTIMVLGHWIEMRSISQAEGALKELAKLLPDTAVRIAGDGVEAVAVNDLRPGDLVLVRPGAGIPADGVVHAAAATSTNP